MNTLTRSYDQTGLGPDASHLCMRLMCAGNEKEIGMVRSKLLEAGIPSETRRHPIAESLGVNGIELWVQNERDFFNASQLYARFKHQAANRSEAAATSQKPEKSGGSVGGAKLKAGPSSAPPKEKKIKGKKTKD